MWGHIPANRKLYSTGLATLLLILCNIYFWCVNRWWWRRNDMNPGVVWNYWEYLLYGFMFRENFCVLCLLCLEKKSKQYIFNVRYWSKTALNNCKGNHCVRTSFHCFLEDCYGCWVLLSYFLYNFTFWYKRVIILLCHILWKSNGCVLLQQWNILFHFWIFRINTWQDLIRLLPLL